jgi:hypothetical protein
MKPLQPKDNLVFPTSSCTLQKAVFFLDNGKQQLLKGQTIFFYNSPLVETIISIEQVNFSTLDIYGNLRLLCFEPQMSQRWNSIGLVIFGRSNICANDICSKSLQDILELVLPVIGGS